MRSPACNMTPQPYYQPTASSFAPAKEEYRVPCPCITCQGGVPRTVPFHHLHLPCCCRATQHPSGPGGGGVGGAYSASTPVLAVKSSFTVSQPAAIPWPGLYRLPQHTVTWYIGRSWPQHTDCVMVMVGACFTYRPVHRHTTNT